MEASKRESQNENENGKRKTNFFNNFLDEWYSFHSHCDSHSLSRSRSLSLLPYFYRFLFIIKPMASMVGFGKVHAYKVGPDSDNIQNAVQIEMWPIAMHRIRWIRLTEFEMKYISIHTTSTTSTSTYIEHCAAWMRAEKRRKVSHFDRFTAFRFIFIRGLLFMADHHSHETYKIFMIRSKVLLLLLQLSHARLIWLESTWTMAIHTFVWSNSVRLFTSVSLLPFFVGDSRQVYISLYFSARKFIC